MALFINELRIFGDIQIKPELFPGNEKDHTLFGYGHESLAPQRGWTCVRGRAALPMNQQLPFVSDSSR